VGAGAVGDHRPGHGAQHRKADGSAYLPAGVEQAGGHPGVRLADAGQGDQRQRDEQLDEYIFRALRAGASGFLLKDTQPAELLQALQVVMRGDALLSPAVTRRLIGEFVARPPDAVAAVGMETLTNREREVVALVAHGMSNDEIANAMVLSPATVKTHVSHAMIKLDVRDRAQLVVFAYQTGLVPPRSARQAPGH
jgi:DNA-binding CsgD family transcriptional regulator